METLTNVLENSLNIPNFMNVKPMSPDEFEAFMIQQENERPGNLTGYDCKVCKNKGYVVKLKDGYRICCECKCMTIRQTIWDLESVGFGNELEKCKFSSFKTNGEEWREGLLRTCLDFLKNGLETDWLFIGGQSQAGKTHICTAVCSHLINSGRKVKYLKWADISHKMDSLKFKDSEFGDFISEIKSCDILYVDDFLKTSTKIINGTDVPDKPEQADLKHAYQVIDARTVSGKKTIISSEHFLPEIITYESATGGRIHRATQNGKFAFNIGRNPERRYSLQ